jgi:GNAT superfamily N-acetyltransferase
VRHNTSLCTRWARRFVARRGEPVVGRVAAIADERFASRWEPGTGLFGFFECGPDPEAAGALLEAVEGCLRARGLRRVIGPVNLTTHDETGILVRGFDSPPMVMSPYNPPYYADLLERAGYAPYRDYHAYLGTPDAEPAPAVRRLERSLALGRGIGRGAHIRPLDPRRWDQEVRTLLELYNAAFADVWGFVPIAWDEFAERARRFRPFVVPALTPIAEVDDRPVGFAVTLPDVNEALAPLDGRLFPFGWLRLVRRIPRIRSARFILLGVRPEYVGRGIGALLASATQAAARRLHVERLELSLVQATNERVRRVIAAFGCPVVKTFRLYAKELAA